MSGWSATSLFISVRNGPGQMALQVTFHGANSTAMARVNCTMAPLLAVYGVRPASPTRPRVLAMWMMRPYRLRFISSMNARVTSHAESTFVDKTCLNWAKLSSSMAPRMLIPALLITMDGEPICDKQKSLSPATHSGSLTSAPWPQARVP